jgi:DNA excision repair protein ERCC-3
VNDGERPLIVQSDRSILVEADHPLYEEARDRLAQFAELEKSPEHMHFYRVSQISVWNAAALSVPLDSILDYLKSRSRYPVPPSLLKELETWYRRYGILRLTRGDGALLLESSDASALEEVRASRLVAPLLAGAGSNGKLKVEEKNRGVLKQALLRLGFPVEDLAGYRRGAALRFNVRSQTLAGRSFALRAYQRDAAAAFHAGGTERGGSGVIVMPCGAGKTMVGMAVMELLQTETLILTTNTVAVRQWRRELLDKTLLTDEQVGEYTGEEKTIRPVTIATYQILTYRRRKTDSFVHFDLFGRKDWGLIVYDEVHLLPAPVFRVTADIQARRRLGLTATLVREDRKEDEVFSLIGPKKYDIPWKDLERRGFIAPARCVEIRVPLTESARREYAASDARAQFRVASENDQKITLVRRLIARHRGDRILVIGQFLDQLHKLELQLQLPLITGATPTVERERLYEDFRQGRLACLMVSKVGNFAIDLPEANAAIQISGTFGSRQEEAQRLGRILRPKSDGRSAVFYSVVSADTRDQDYSAKRQLFLTEQGYPYEILEASRLDGERDDPLPEVGT